MSTHVLFILILLLPPFFSGGQAKLAENKRGYCEWGGCTLRPEDAAHFDPYYNGHLCENFDPAQADFSNMYFRLRSKALEKFPSDLLSGYDLSPFFLTIGDHQNGIIGLDYQRIRIHIPSVKKDMQNPGVYLVTGKSNVKGNVCDFSGSITITKAFRIAGDSEHEHSGQLLATYVFYEDTTQKHVGVFKGTFEGTYFIDQRSRKGFLDESAAIADGYFNRTYVGTWTSYTTKASKKCIWGDYRLPFTFDFDCGDGEMVPCDKYLPNGWTALYKGEEYTITDNKRMLKDKWWE